jgi:undecaprenyl-diphosphatase
MLMPARKLRLFGAFSAIAALGTPTAGAQQIPQSPAPVRFEVHAWPDAVLTGAGLVLTALPLFLPSPVASPCPCDVSGLPGVDRGAVGPIASGPASWSSITLLATVGLAGAGLVVGRQGQPGEAATEDIAIYGQALLVSSGLTSVLKTVVGRPRPYVYDAAPTGTVPRDAVSSFPSGHTSTAFAAAAAYWSIMQRKGEAGRHVPQIVGLFALASATAVLRVSAHEHFPTDVFAGAVLGTGVGWAIPHFHAVH